MPDTGGQILESLRSLGVAVRVVRQDTLRLEPASKIPSEIVLRIREEKPAILEALRNRPAEPETNCGSPHCAGCYDVGDGSRTLLARASSNCRRASAFNPKRSGPQPGWTSHLVGRCQLWR